MKRKRIDDGKSARGTKDLSSKIGPRGFNNSRVLLSKKQKEQAKGQKGEGEEAYDPYGLVPGQVDGPGGVVDLEAFFAGPNGHSPGGSPAYVPAQCIPVREFDPVEDTPPNPSMLFFGMRRTGKTFAMTTWAYNWKNYYDQVYVFTETKLNNYWTKIVPQEAVYEGWLPSVAEKLLKIQRKVKKDTEQGIRNPEGLTTKTLFVLDDVISSRIVRDDSESGPLAQVKIIDRTITQETTNSSSIRHTCHRDHLQCRRSQDLAWSPFSRVS